MVARRFVLAFDIIQFI